MSPLPRSRTGSSGLSRILVAVLLFALPPTGFAASGGAAAPGPEIAPDPAVSAILGAMGKAGWEQAESPRTFSPDTLYEEIDGEAELYLPYDFRGLTVVILRRPAAPAAELRLEAYRHGSPGDAFGIFSQYRFPGQETARLGPCLAAISDASIDCFRGSAFVRLRVVAGSLSRDALLAAGRTVVEAIGGPAEPPPGAAVVAVPGVVAGSILYQKKAMLGFEPLAPGYEARFESGGVSARVIFIDGAEAPPGYRERIAKALPGFRTAGEGEWTAGLPQGTLYLKAAGSGLVGVLGKPLTREQASPLLESLLRGASRPVPAPAGR